jgi:hypothetical protein
MQGSTSAEPCAFITVLILALQHLLLHRQQLSLDAYFYSKTDIQNYCEKLISLNTMLRTI